MKLRHPKPIITTHSNITDTKKLPLAARITRWIYFSILISIVIYIILYGVYRFFYIDNWGFVNVERIRIASSRGGRIMEIPVHNGDHVNKGDLLVRLKSLNECTVLTSSSDDVSSKLRTLQKKQLIDREKLNNLYIQSKEIKKRIQGIKYRRSLELSRGSNNLLASLEKEQVEIGGDIRILNSIIVLRKKEIEQLKTIDGNIDRTKCHDEIIRAPFDATVISKDYSKFEVVQRTEPILDLIADDANVYIEGYFENNVFRTIEIGKEYTIYFPDGSISEGRVTDIKSTALAFPNRKYHDDYLPFRTRILALITPIHEEDTVLWKKFNQIEVKIRGWR